MLKTTFRSHLSAAFSSTFESAASSRRRSTFNSVTKRGPLHFAAVTVTQSSTTATTTDPLVFLPKDHVELESKFPLGASNHTLVQQSKIGYDEETASSG